MSWLARGPPAPCEPEIRDPTQLKPTRPCPIICRAKPKLGPSCVRIDRPGSPSPIETKGNQVFSVVRAWSRQRFFVESSRNWDPPACELTGRGARHQSKQKEIKYFPLYGHGPVSRFFVEPSRNRNPPAYELTSLGARHHYHWHHQYHHHRHH